MYFRILAGFLGIFCFWSVAAANGCTPINDDNREACAIESEKEAFQKRIDGIDDKIEGKDATESEPVVVAIGELDLSTENISKTEGQTYDKNKPAEVPIEVEIDWVKQVLDTLGDGEKMRKWKLENETTDELAAKVQKCLKGVLLEAGEANLTGDEKSDCAEEETSAPDPKEGTEEGNFIGKNGIDYISHYLNKTPPVEPILPRIETFEKAARDWQNLLEDLQVLGADLDNSEVLGEGVTGDALKERDNLILQIEETKKLILKSFKITIPSSTTSDPEQAEQENKQARNEAIKNLKKAINDYLQEIAIQRMRAKSLKLMLEHDETIRALWNTVDNSRGFSVSGVLSVGNEADWELVSVDPESRTNILAYLIRLALQVIGTFAILMLVVGGYLMMTALNDDNRLQKGKTIVITTIAGLIIAFLSYLIVKVLFAFMF